MSFKDNQFIVINRKHLELVGATHPDVSELLVRSIQLLHDMHEVLFGSSIDHQYYVCNQDEEYAPDVLRLILLNEGEE